MNFAGNSLRRDDGHLFRGVLYGAVEGWHLEGSRRWPDRHIRNFGSDHRMADQIHGGFTKTGRAAITISTSHLLSEARLQLEPQRVQRCRLCNPS